MDERSVRYVDSPGSAPRLTPAMCAASESGLNELDCILVGTIAAVRAESGTHSRVVRS